MAKTPIRHMGLHEAKRSLLMQIKEERELSVWLLHRNITELTVEEVDETVQQFLVRHSNILQTVEHIELLETR